MLPLFILKSVIDKILRPRSAGLKLEIVRKGYTTNEASVPYHCTIAVDVGQISS